MGLLEASWVKHDLALRKNIQTWTAGDVAGQLLAFSGRESVRYEAPSRTLAFQGKTPWQRAVPKPAQVTALVLTGSHVVVGGSRDRQLDDLHHRGVDAVARPWLRPGPWRPCRP